MAGQTSQKCENAHKVKSLVRTSKTLCVLSVIGKLANAFATIKHLMNASIQRCFIIAKSLAQYCSLKTAY